MGGDLYHFLRANRCRVIFGMLDVAGRLEENHSIVDAARRTFQEVGQEKFAYEEINEADAMMELCLELNLSIRRAAAGVRSCAAFVGCYNEELGTICYANAGHTPGLLRDPSGITELPATGLPLGLFSASTYEAPTAALQKGASLLLVSRGVVEAAHKHKKEEFGLSRVKETFTAAPPENASEIATDILTAVQAVLREAGRSQRCHCACPGSSVSGTIGRDRLKQALQHLRAPQVMQMQYAQQLAGVIHDRQGRDLLLLHDVERGDR